MKKFILILAAVLMLCSCAAGENPENETAENDTLGIALSVRNVTPTGATVVFTQSGGNPTGELTTGSYYRIEDKNGEAAYIIEGDIAWTAEAYMIKKEGETSMETDWQWLYGSLEPGTYRIFKEVMDFRGPGDYDEKEYYAEFIIE